MHGYRNNLKNQSSVNIWFPWQPILKNILLIITIVIYEKKFKIWKFTSKSVKYDIWFPWQPVLKNIVIYMYQRQISLNPEKCAKVSQA